jgi:hypothetical protein
MNLPVSDFGKVDYQELTNLNLAVFAFSDSLVISLPSGDVPLDGGSGFLLAALGIYGAKKLRDRRKKAE